ncbi:MAG: type II secretion system minor pseudopilin GspJ [Pseudomonadota bacterium]
MIRSAGFTLVEVLIAMAITAVVATLSFVSLDTTLSSVESLQQEGERIADLNRAWSLLQRDLNHFVDRPVRNEFGGRNQAMQGGELAEQTLAFTRIGWHNTTARVRSNMERVRYVLEDETFYRERFLVLDRTAETEPVRVDLLQGVSAVEYRFLPAGFPMRPGEFDTTNWPDAWAIGPASAAPSPPQALEIRMTLADYGEVTWLYELPGAGT